MQHCNSDQVHSLNGSYLKGVVVLIGIVLINICANSCQTRGGPLV